MSKQDHKEMPTREYCKKYKRHRKNSGAQFQKQYGLARLFLKDNPGYAQMPTVAMSCIIIKKYVCTIRDMGEEFAALPGLRWRLDMAYVSSKFCIHKWMGRMPMEWHCSLLAFTAGRGA